MLWGTGVRGLLKKTRASQAGKITGSGAKGKVSYSSLARESKLEAPTRKSQQKKKLFKVPGRKIGSFADGKGKKGPYSKGRKVEELYQYRSGRPKKKCLRNR